MHYSWRPEQTNWQHPTCGGPKGTTYYNVGTIGNDQLADWARRNAIAEADARRALAPQLG